METQWTIESLRDFLLHLVEINDKRYDQRFSDAKMAVDIAFSAQKESVSSALSAAERAVLKAELASEKRFDAVNEFRATLADQQRMLMPRAEAEIIFKSLSERVNDISDEQKKKQGEESGSSSTVSWIITGISLLIALASFLMKKGGN